MSECRLHFTGGREGNFCWGRKDEEYIADFLLMVRRELSDVEHRVFRFHHLLGGDWKLCCMKLKMEKGEFFHLVYRIEQRLGRVFRETEPYGLFPLDEYFHGTTRSVTASTPRREGPAPVQPPVTGKRRELLAA